MKMNYRNKRIKVSAILLLSLVTILSSCKKEATDIGLSVQPEDELLNATLTDTFQLETYSVLEDSLKTSNLSNCLLGSYVDPIFGKSSAEVYTQFALSTYLSTIDIVNTTVDSVKLQLTYSGHYGVEDVQTFSVKKITEKFFKDSSYYSNQTLTTTGIELIVPGDETQMIDHDNNVVVGADTLDPMLLLNLDPAFGMDILNGVAGGNLASESAFANFFYGLNISVNNVSQSTGQGCINYLDLNDAQTKMIIYYHENGTAKVLSMPIGSNQARFSSFTHDYTGTAIANQLSSPALGQEYFYVQAMDGLKGIVKIKGIDGFKNMGNIIINKAELFLPVQYFTTDIYSPSSSSILLYTNDEGDVSVTVDQVTSASVYGGSYDNTKKGYTFNIGRHVQRIVKGEIPNLGFEIFCMGGSVSANRTVFSGTSSPNRAKPSLKIYYTKY